MSDILQRIRETADIIGSAVNGSAFAEFLRDRFPEAFAELRSSPAPNVCVNCGSTAVLVQSTAPSDPKILETGSPEQVALAYLVDMLPDGQNADRIMAHIRRTGAWRDGDSRERILSRVLRKRHNFIRYVRGIGSQGHWFATDAGRAEDEKHRRTP